MSHTGFLMKRAVLALLAAVLALAACSSGGDTFTFHSATQLGQLYPKAERKPAGGFTGQLLDGGTTSLAAQRGKVVVLNFWASWCAPCRIESPQFNFVYRDMAGRGVTFLGIDTKDVKSNAKAFVHDFHIAYPIVYDEQGEIGLRIGDLPTRGLPFTVLIDRTGQVAAVYEGQLTAKDLTTSLDKLLREPRA